MKVYALKILHWLKIGFNFLCDLIGWFLYNVIFTSVPVLVSIIVRAIAGLPIDLNNLTPDILLIGFSIACTVCLCIFNNEDILKKGLRKFVIMTIVTYDSIAIAIYTLFYLRDNIDGANQLILLVEDNMIIFLHIILGLLLVLSLFGAFIEAGNKQKQKDGKLLLQKSTQSRETAQSTSG